MRRNKSNMIRSGDGKKNNVTMKRWKPRQQSRRARSLCNHVNWNLHPRVFHLHCLNIQLSLYVVSLPGRVYCAWRPAVCSCLHEECTSHIRLLVRNVPFRTFPSVARNSLVLSRKQARSCWYRSRVGPRPMGLRSSGLSTWSMVGQSSLAKAAEAASPFCLESGRKIDNRGGLLL